MLDKWYLSELNWQKNLVIGYIVTFNDALYLGLRILYITLHGLPHPFPEIRTLAKFFGVWDSLCFLMHLDLLVHF